MLRRSQGSWEQQVEDFHEGSTEMAEDGYEVMGPTGGAAAAPPPAAIPAFPAASAPGPPAPRIPPPPPPPAAAVIPPPPAKETKVAADSEKAEAQTEKIKPAKKKRSNDSAVESVIESADGDGMAVFQRPNCCDMTQLALVILVFLIVVGSSVPVILTAVGKADIEAIRNKLLTV
ncbi:unnamed protein product [Caenorhabditis sp. 36 PRJEB53466]|nr:unnamed protein product [Caenorhabditis sp. 36 PRJEB53466]